MSTGRRVIGYVAAAGNDGDASCFSGTPPSWWDSNCSVSSYAYYPDSLAVGGTNTVVSLGDLDATMRATCSSFGMLPATLAGGRASQAIPIDVVTNFFHNFVASNGTNNFETVGIGGTSFAAPTIAGVNGLIADWIHDRGGFGSLAGDPYALRTFTSWMADGRGVAWGVPVEWARSLDTQFGFGNVRFADVDNLGSGSGFDLKRMTLSNGSSTEWWVGGSTPRSTSINGWKFVALVDRNSYDGAPDLRIELIDFCPSGGGTVVLQTAERNALKYRLRMTEPMLATNFWGRCLKVRVTVENASSSFLFYAADGFYTGSRTLHDSEVF